MRHDVERTRWVAYARVSTPQQAEKELSLPAQLDAIRGFAQRHGATISEEYVEPGASGTDSNRKVFKRLLGEALKPNSDISTIVVLHTSRFSRNAGEARLMKVMLKKSGVRVLSVQQEHADDPAGNLMEGIFECFDQYESELIGLRTSAAMREAVKQGYWPGARSPYGYRSEPVEVRPGVVRHKLVVEPEEARVIREVFALYIAGSGGRAVAEKLNARGSRTRLGNLWNQNLMMLILDEEALTGTVWWGRRKRNELRPKDEWLSLQIEPTVDPDTWALAQRLRTERAPDCRPGRAPEEPQLLKGLVWCGKCGASYQRETSCKDFGGERYTYTYYNCRTRLRIGPESCKGYRISTEVLDEAVLTALSKVVCTEQRARAFSGVQTWPLHEVTAAWDRLLRTPEVARSYVVRLIERVEVHDERVVVTPANQGRARQPVSQAVD